MGHVPRILASFVVLAAIANVRAVAFDGPTQTTGASKTAPGAGSSTKQTESAPSPKEKAAAAAQKALDAGHKAYEAGKSKQAIQLLNTAIGGGGLQSPQVAKALYYRGLAYRKEDKPGQAISDLTSAAWLKGALSATERANALTNRDAAYREAGINNPPEASQSAVVTAEAPPPAAGNAAISTGSSTGTSSGWETALTGPAAPATVPASPPGTGTPASGPAPSAVPGADSGTTQSNSGGGIGGFFSNITSLFSGGSSNETPAPQSAPAVTTASINPPPAATSSWSGTTQVAATSPPAPAKPPPAKPAQVTTPFQTQVAAAPPAAPPAPAKPAQVTTPFQTQVAAAPPAARAAKSEAARAPAGKFRLQVAAVRSRGEADALAARLVQKHRSQIGSRQPVIDEAVIGSMGTFYRVRLGPYASAKEPQQLCGSLRTSGFDCLVVTQ